MLRKLPRALVARYAPLFLKQALRRAWWRVQRLRGRGPAPRLLFAFGGRTEYAPGTGRDLYAHEPVFRATVQECERITQQVLGGPSIIGSFTGPPVPHSLAEEARLMLTSVVMQLALVELWRAQGVQPAAVLGISLGEVAAVYAAGGLSLTDALRVGLCYCRISQVTQPDYRMLVVKASFETAGRLAGECPVELFVVLIVDASCCLAFCPKAAAPAAQQHLAAHGIASILPPTQLIWPYHSPGLARHLATLRQLLHGLQPQPLAYPCYLTTAGGQLSAGTVLGPEYWLALMQYPVNVHGALGAALADGYSLFVPIGAAPFPFLFEPAQRAVLQATHILPGLRVQEPERTTFANSRQLLAERGLVGPAPLPRPALGAATFIAQFSLGALEAQADPYPAYAHLRQQGGLHFLPADRGWLVLDIDLINTVLREALLFSSADSNFDAELIGADPPVHTANRALFQPFFSPKALAVLGNYAAATIAEQAAAMHTRPAFDFVADFAVPITQRVSAQLLGLAPAECQRLQASLPGHVYGLGYVEELSRFFAEYFEQQQPTAAPTMLNQLLAHIRSGQLTPEAALSLVKTMWLASIATTSILMGQAAHYLLTHPHVAEELRRQPTLIDAFVEEILRLEPSLPTFWRHTTQAVVLGGQALPAGSAVLCSIAAANRDPARFARPDELDLHRRPGRHLAFGGGIHACLGAYLARLEARLVVQWLLAPETTLRLTNLALLPEYYPSSIFRGLAQLSVTSQPLTAA